MFWYFCYVLIYLWVYFGVEDAKSYKMIGYVIDYDVEMTRVILDNWKDI